MKRILLALLFLTLIIGIAAAQLTFYLVDNFEDGNLSKWYVFDKAKATIVPNPVLGESDSISEACGEKSLKIAGDTENWYVGGMGTILDVDGAGYTRMLVDIYGSDKFGKIKFEMFEKNTSGGTQEAKWVVELPILGKGFTRYSIPFTSFTLDGAKEVTFHSKKGGKITKLQLIFIAGAEKGSIDLALDNLIFTF